MRFTFRLKLVAIVAIGAISMVVVALASAIYEDRIENKVSSIRQEYLPKIRLKPQLEASFEKVGRTLKDAADANEPDQLKVAEAEHGALLAQIAEAKGAISVGQIAALRLAVDDYYTAALAVARKQLTGQTGETLADEMQAMQARQMRAAQLIDQVTQFDETQLTAAFDSTAGVQQTASRVRLAVGIACLVALLALSIWIGSGVVREPRRADAGLRAVRAQRLRAPRSRRRPTTSSAMSRRRRTRWRRQLRRLDSERAQPATGSSAGSRASSDALRGELEPARWRIARVTYLARYVDAPVGALYYGDPGLTSCSASSASVDVPATLRARRGLGRPGGVAHRVTVVDGIEGLGAPLALWSRSSRVRSCCCRSCATRLVTGVLELGAHAGMARGRRGAAGARERGRSRSRLEVARAAPATRALLDQTQLQARELDARSADSRAEGGRAREGERVQVAVPREHVARAAHAAQRDHRVLRADVRRPGPARLAGARGVPRRHPDERPPPAAADQRRARSREGRGRQARVPPRADRARDACSARCSRSLRTTAATQQVAHRRSRSTEPVDERRPRSGAAQAGRSTTTSRTRSSSRRPAAASCVRATRRGRRDACGSRSRTPASGSPPDELGRLFVEFQQLEAGARQSGASTGLGLALTKRLVEAQGGRSACAARVGKGSMFSRDPAAADGHSTTAPRAPPRRPLRTQSRCAHRSSWSRTTPRSRPAGRDAVGRGLRGRGGRRPAPRRSRAASSARSTRSRSICCCPT